jgi:isopentenyl-diphosphate Delta-isomerase
MAIDRTSAEARPRFDDDDELMVLVDEHDREIGAGPKLYVHRIGLLHRAVSVFIVNSRGEHLLQRRAPGKYHSAGLWSNSCCTHPRRGETPAATAHRRLHEEMGIACALQHVHSFVYRAAVGAALVEHEFDHVFVGVHEDAPEPDPQEVGAWRWASADRIARSLEHRPERFTAWFRVIYDHIAGVAGALPRSHGTATL